MKHYYYAILLLISLVGGMWPGRGVRAQTPDVHVPDGSPIAGTANIGDLPLLADSLAVDRLERKILKDLHEKKRNAIDSVPFETMTMLAMHASERLGYIHGKAVALACQAIYLDMHKDDFIRAGQLARESLDAFGQTGNQDEIIRAHYALGFALFAQSRYEEALYYYAKAGDDASRSGDSVEEITMLSLEGEAYRERGDYEKAFDIQRHCIQMAESFNHPELVRAEYMTLAELFVQIEDYTSAEKYFRMGFGTARPDQVHPWDMMAYAELLTHQHKYDSALYYYGRFDSANAEPGMLKAYLVSKGEYYLCRGDYAAALPYFANSLDYQRRLNDGNQLMRCLGDLSRSYAGLRQNAAAFRYAREDLSLAGAVHARQNIRDACQLLSSLYDREGRTDSAYFYFRRYILLKDSVLNDQLKGKFASYGFEQQIRLLNQEKQLVESCIREEMLTKRLLIAGIAVLLLFSVIYFRFVRLKRRNEEYRRKRAENELEIQRLEGERAKAALLQRARELEVQALRSQMNPHFVFNCLNAINRFILSHEAEAASDYLTKFSRLMRMIMNHSRHSIVTLAEETEMLRLYLDMERLRFKDAFDYSIVTGANVDAGELMIPPLLLQPFVENAVWHGLMHKEERGWLLITMEVHDQVLTCIIRDNGIGRRRAALLKSKSVEKHKSMGLRITAERMALLTGTDAKEPFFTIEDLYDEDGEAAGTQVTLTIRVYQHTGEPVDITS